MADTPSTLVIFAHPVLRRWFGNTLLVNGLIMATAGCPWTDRLRPMARFHLPFATEAETVYRDALAGWRKSGDHNPGSLWGWGQLCHVLVAQRKYREVSQTDRYQRR